MNSCLANIRYTLQPLYMMRFICLKNIDAGSFFVIKCSYARKIKVLRNQKNPKLNRFSQFNVKI